MCHSSTILPCTHTDQKSPLYNYQVAWTSLVIMSLVVSGLFQINTTFLSAGTFLSALLGLAIFERLVSFVVLPCCARRWHSLQGTVDCTNSKNITFSEAAIFEISWSDLRQLSIAKCVCRFLCNHVEFSVVVTLVSLYHTSMTSLSMVAIALVLAREIIGVLMLWLIALDRPGILLHETIDPNGATSDKEETWWVVLQFVLPQFIIYWIRGKSDWINFDYYYDPTWECTSSSNSGISLVIFYFSDRVIDIVGTIAFLVELMSDDGDGELAIKVVLFTLCFVRLLANWINWHFVIAYFPNKKLPPLNLYLDEKFSKMFDGNLYWKGHLVEHVFCHFALAFCISLVVWFPVLATVYDEIVVTGAVLLVLGVIFLTLFTHAVARISFTYDWRQTCCCQAPGYMDCCKLSFWCCASITSISLVVALGIVAARWDTALAWELDAAMNGTNGTNAFQIAQLDFQLDTLQIEAQSYLAAITTGNATTITGNAKGERAAWENVATSIAAALCLVDEKSSLELALKTPAGKQVLLSTWFPLAFVAFLGLLVLLPVLLIVCRCKMEMMQRVGRRWCRWCSCCRYKNKTRKRSSDVQTPLLPLAVIKWHIFPFLDFQDFSDIERFHLRQMCRHFRDALPPPTFLWTTYPHPKYPTLKSLVARINKLSRTGVSTAGLGLPQIMPVNLTVGLHVFAQWKSVMEPPHQLHGTLFPGTIKLCRENNTFDVDFDDGDHRSSVPLEEIHITEAPLQQFAFVVYVASGVHRVEVSKETNYIDIDCSLALIGASRKETIVEGGFNIGRTSRALHVRLENMTVRKSEQHGCVSTSRNTEIHCTDVSFDGCRNDGVSGVRGTLTDCTVTNCGNSGINAACGDIHIYGAKTQVTGNVLKGICSCPGSNGLNSKSRSSKIILHAPLTKQFVSHHNHMVMNWSKQHIDTVDA